MTDPGDLAALLGTVRLPAVKLLLPARLVLLGAALFVLLGAPTAGQQSADLEQIRTRAAGGDPEAQNALGNAYTNGLLGLPQDHAEALHWYQRAAEKSSPPALFNLGLAHDLGRGVAKDDTVAFRYYLKAAEQGFPAAMFNVGNMYATGRGVRQDLFESNLWYRQAADKGVPEAQFNLGLAYEAGRGIKQDEGLAAQWYQRAADRGFALAQYNLGLLLEDGRGVAKDEAAAARYYRAAAEAGVGSAQNNYGLMFHEGRGGLAVDPVSALFWLSLAVEQGVDPLARDTVARTLTIEQSQAAQRMIEAHRLAPKLQSASAGSAASVLAAAPGSAPTSGPGPSLEKQPVHDSDSAKLVEQLRDQVGRLASQVLAIAAEKNTLEERLKAERASSASKPAAQTSREAEKLTAQVREAHTEITRLRGELASAQERLKIADSSVSQSRQLTSRVRELEAELRQVRATAVTATPAGTGDSILSNLQQQVRSLQRENRELERWVQTLEASVKSQPKNAPEPQDSTDLAAKLTETEQILTATKRALEAQLAREEKLKVENSLLVVRFQQAEELLATQASGGKPSDIIDLKRALQQAQGQIETLKREKEGLANVWVDEQRSLMDAKSRIAELESELSQAWKTVERNGNLVPLVSGQSQSAHQLGGPDEVARLRREQENAAALLAISRHALDATQNRTDELTSEVERLRRELARVQSAQTGLTVTQTRDPERDRLIADLRTENEELTSRLAKIEGAINQIVSVVRHGAPASGPSTLAPSGGSLVAKAPRFHVVKDGDSLSRISQRYYGTPDRWEDIYQANSLELIDSKTLRAGQRLLIP